jgi:acyl carrier protein
VPERAQVSAPLLSAREQVEQAYRTELGVETVDPSKNLYELGGDSLMAIEVTARLETGLAIHISPQEVLMKSVEQLVTLIESQRRPKEEIS